MRRAGFVFGGAMAAWALMTSGASAAYVSGPEDLARLSIEELADIEITSVSKRPERLGEAAASVFVITNDDIRRSGATTLAETLRLAPNLNVQRVDATDYGISARGVNGFESANKLLVLIDGRSVYSPFFSGVEWSQLHPNMPDVDRIEVVSGPGGTLYGANAVNGVVNVVTRSAAATQGLLFEAMSGTGDSLISARVGGMLTDSAAIRIYARAYDRAETRLNGRGVGDGWNGGQIGFRTDFGGGANSFTLQGDLYHDDVVSMIPGAPEGKFAGSNLLGRWTRSFAEGSTFELQAYYDRYERRARGILDGVITYDIQGQQTFQYGRHRVVVGAGYRRWHDKFHNYVNGFVLDPPSMWVSLGNAFVQDQIDLGPLTLTLGIKAEHSSFSGTEILPNARLAWRASDKALFWGAVSRSVRNPSRLDRNLVFPPILLASTFQPETLIAYELGYRGQLASRLSLSATLFYHDYNDIRSSESTPVTVIPIRIGNGLEGRTQGVEAWADFDVTQSWRLGGGLTAMDKKFKLSPGSLDRSNLASAGHDPKFQGFLRSQHRLGQDVDVDMRVRYVSKTPKDIVGGYLDAPAYVEADARVAWRLNDRVEFSVAGLNLLHKSHFEATEPRRSEGVRSVQAGLRLNW